MKTGRILDHHCPHVSGTYYKDEVVRKHAFEYFILRYHKNSYSNCPKNGNNLFYNAAIHSNHAIGKVNSVDPDLTLPKELSDLNLHCLLISVCPNTYNFYSKPISFKRKQGKIQFQIFFLIHTFCTHT